MNPLFVYCLNLTAIALLSYLFYRLIRESNWKKYFLVALIFKLICGILLGFLYIWIYDSGGDTFGYYRRSSQLAALDWDVFWKTIIGQLDYQFDARRQYFDRTLAVVLFLTKSDYWLVSLYFSLFSFVCSSYLVRQIIRWRPDWSKAAVFSFLFYPSMVFWSSGILKESLAFGAVMVLMGGYVKLRANKCFYWFEFLWYVLSFVILVYLKYYVLAVILPLLAYLLIFRRLGSVSFLQHSLWRKTGIIVIVLFVPSVALFYWLNYNLTVQYFWTTINDTHQDILTRTPIWNKVPIVYTSNQFMDIVLNFIHFTLAGVFRPIFPEVFRFPNIMSAIENLALVVLVGWRFLSAPAVKYNADLLAITILVVTMAFFLAYSIPNLGALARFKVYYMPFFMMALLIEHPVWHKVGFLRRV